MTSMNFLLYPIKASLLMLSCLSELFLCPLFAFVEFRQDKFHPAEVPYLSPEEFEPLVDKATQGNADALYRVARALLDGWPIEQNQARGILFLEAALAKGSQAAETHTGYCYLFGIGYEQNLPLAKEHFKRAAEQGDPVAQHNLATMYLEALGVARNYDLANTWYQKAAEQGYAPSQCAYGYHLIFFGSNRDQSKETGIDLLQQSAHQDWGKAYSLLAWYLSVGDTSLGLDKQLSFEYVRYSAQLGNPKDQFMLSRYYDPNEALGEDMVEKCTQKAKQWKKSAKALGVIR